MVIVNWLSTLAILFLTGETLLLRRMRVVNDTDILGVLFASLFALPGMRRLSSHIEALHLTINRYVRYCRTLRLLGVRLVGNVCL